MERNIKYNAIEAMTIKIKASTSVDRFVHVGVLCAKPFLRYLLFKGEDKVGEVISLTD